jgi:K+-transporting ATPase ATPase A chain
LPGIYAIAIPRPTLYVLLPICIVATLFLVRQGVRQTFGPYLGATTLEGANQMIARGPVASQMAIKLLSGDGGGFFNANSVHPFENPTALTGMLEMLLIFLIGVALTNSFGRMVGDQRQGWALFAAMAVLFAAGLAAMYAGETAPNKALAAFGLDQTPGEMQAGGNMEGKEVRFGPGQSALFATVTTASSDGAVDAMHDSFMPLSGLVLLANMMLDEVIVGGPGSGLFGMLLFAIVAVFAAGLMIGQTSGAATNGSAFAGLSANTPFYNLTLATAMFAGRFIVIVPVLCIAGTLAAKRVVPVSAGTLPTFGLQFVGLLIGTVLIVGGLTFFPALALGPIAEQFAMQAGLTY